MKFTILVMGALFLAILASDPRWRPAALGGAFILRIGLPSVVASTGVFGAYLHVSTILVLFYALIWPLALRGSFSEAANFQRKIPASAYLIIAAVATGSVVVSGFSPVAVALALNQIVAPFAFCVLVYRCCFDDESLYTNAGRLFTLCCVAESVVALAVYFAFVPQPFMANYWAAGAQVGEGARQVGTLDHPLALGLLLAAGIPFVAQMKSRLYSHLSLLLIVAGISVTQSRIGIAAAVIGVLYLIAAGSRKFQDRMSLAIAAIAGYALLEATGVLSGLISRIQNDDGSAQARQLAAQLFRENWTEFSISGVGIQYGKDYFLSQGLVSSGESAAISYAVGIGIPLTILYFALIVWMIGRGMDWRSGLSPASVASIIVLVSIQFYSSIATESAAAMILWTVIGIALAKPRMPVRSDPPDMEADTPNIDGRTPVEVKLAGAEHSIRAPLSVQNRSRRRFGVS